MIGRILILLVLPSLLWAQVDTLRDGNANPPAERPGVTPAHADSARGDADTSLVRNGPAARHDSIGTPVAMADTINLHHLWLRPSAVNVLLRDSLSLMDYHHLGEVLEHFPGVQLANLGNLGQPAWLGRSGSDQSQYAFTVNGLATQDQMTGRSDPYMFFTEDAEAITLYPMHQAFWYGGPGRIVAADIHEKKWNSPHPVTRIRHLEAANEYLFTDVIFNMNPGDGDNLHIGVTRSTIGSTSLNNTARFENTLSEYWGVRLRFQTRLSERLTGEIKGTLHDVVVNQNGGVAGEIDSIRGILTYPDRDGSDFATTAFDPITAVLVNPTMAELRRQYGLQGRLSLQWDADSAVVTSLRLNARSDIRRFRDNLAQYTGDSLAEPFLNLTDHWVAYDLVLDHSTTLDWADLRLQGIAQPYDVSGGGASLSASGVNTSVKGQLGFTVHPLRLTAFARLDNTYGQNTLGFGGTLEASLSTDIFAWFGFSLSARPYSLFEMRYVNERTTVSGNRDARLEKSNIIEGGLRWDSGSWLTVALSGYYRHTQSYLSVYTAAYSDTVLGRYTLAFHEGDRTLDVIGGSAYAHLRLWLLHLELQGAVNTYAQSGDALSYPLGPELSGSTDLYFRGNLIEGSLDLKLGGRAAATEQFQPTVYNPEVDWFGLPSPNETVNGNVRSYTTMVRLDIYVYATIRRLATLHFSVFNVLDARYITTQFYPMYERSFRFGVDWILFD